MRLLSSVLIASCFSALAFGQAYNVSIFAGGGRPVNIPPTSASLGFVRYMAADASGNVYFVYRHSVLMAPGNGGIITLVAGTGIPGFSGDGGPAKDAQLNSPSGLAVDSNGNLYIADTLNNRVREVANGVITTVVGNGISGFSGDGGPAPAAELASPGSLALDSHGAVYIADRSNERIRKVASGVITSVAGNGNVGFSGDGGPATSAALNFGDGLAVDSAGNLYFCDTNNYRIRMVSNGVITTVAGNGNGGSSSDGGPATAARLALPDGLAVDAAGNLYISVTTVAPRVRKVSNGVIATVAGNGLAGFGGDGGPARNANLFNPSALSVDSSGNLYIADTDNRRIREVSGGTIKTIVGDGSNSFSGDNGPASAAQLYGGSGVAVDSSGAVYVADTGNNRVRKISGGTIVTVVGSGIAGYSGDGGPAVAAQLNFPEAVALDPAGNLYIADSNNQVIRKVSNGVITTVVGNGTYGFAGDGGPATSAELQFPIGVVLDPAGSLYVAEALGNRVRKISNGVITTLAGNGTNGFSGDGGPAANAELNFPEGLALDRSGNLYIADAFNSRIRKVSTNGVITTFAGTGVAGFSGDGGPASSAELQLTNSINLSGLSVDSSGDLWIADTRNNRIRNVSSGTIATVAGGGLGSISYSSDSATAVALFGPAGLAADPSGNLYVTDANGLVLLLTPPPPPPPPSAQVLMSSSANPSSLGQSVTFTAVVSTSGGTESVVPTGTVQFSDGETLLGTLPLVDGQAAYTTTRLGGGTHRIGATYSGDGIFPLAAATYNQAVFTSITFGASATPQSPTYGQTITFTSNVGATTVPAGFSAPTGQVSFWLDGPSPFSSPTLLGAAPLASGSASISLNTIPIGKHYVEADYSGDGSWPPVSRQIIVVVSPAATSTSVSLAISSGQLVVSGMVIPAGGGTGTPTGTVLFVDTNNQNAVVANAALSGGKVSAQVGASVAGSAIAAIYSGDANFNGSTSAALPRIANGASYTSAIAPDGIASAFGITGLSGDTLATLPLTTSLNGVAVNLTDSAGATHAALLYGAFGSQGQVNFVVPSGTAPGLATIVIASNGSTAAATVVNIAGIAPALFTANTSGQGTYAGQVVYAHADGTQTIAPSVGAPVDLSVPGDRVYLVLYGTGLRHASSATASINGVTVPLAYAGEQPTYPGLDQINLGPLPSSLAGSGQVTLVITTDRQSANNVSIVIQ